MEIQNQNTANEPQADYEKAEIDLLKEGLKRTHKERFLFLMTLIKVQNTLKKAKITHKTLPKL